MNGLIIQRGMYVTKINIAGKQGTFIDVTVPIKITTGTFTAVLTTQTPGTSVSCRRIPPSANTITVGIRNYYTETSVDFTGLYWIVKDY